MSMQFVTAWELVNAIGSQLEVSASERATTLRLADEVAQTSKADTPGVFRNQTMGELKHVVVMGLASAFEKAHRISRGAAILDSVLHHAGESTPSIFDLRQTGLPRLSETALSELLQTLIRAANFEKRLIDALESGAFRDYPLHGRSGNWVGLNPTDWTSHPSDMRTVTEIVFSADQVLSLFRREGVKFGRLHDAFTENPIADWKNNNSIELDEPNEVENAPQTADAEGHASKRRTNDLTPVIIKALKEAVSQGTELDPKLCGKVALRIVTKWADESKFSGLVEISSESKLVYYSGNDEKPLTPKAFQARVDRVWERTLPLLKREKR